ncbi:UDP-N-acetylglucosamine 4,6-dehydratase [Algibacter pacificus]|uniref:UDP-N-acetylglucosamine 4,6-dehydratase n=1 Tax=Algibacter pacificus TaxID=2599389 RepID=UPI0011C8DB9E|nr:UDP-N-acetylglucosamine 4,6-dehydratase [Algibacter pacificus]
MNTATINQIDQLLKNSGLFPEEGIPTQNISNFNFSNETILITGAAGSIGSELSKQLINCQYKKLILIDIAESPLYHLINEPEFENASNIHFLILNITEKDAIQHLFETYKPTIILHAAAYKHVPLMEANPFESIKVNISGTKRLADLAHIHNVKKFIFISTDKAVNPKSVMGISKRIATDYLMSLSEKSQTRFLTTRFGNVLGSNGSVVPLFKKRIEMGKPLIITNKAISRYFINTQKACHLILELTNDNHEKSNLFTFNMGNPIKIIDLVERLILFCNKKDVDVQFSELRPGEKVYEDLFSDNETLLATTNKDILLVKKKQEHHFSLDFLERLFKINAFTPHHEVKAILKSYISN